MKISLNWLRDFVPTDLSAAEVADLLTMAGLEVEGVEEAGRPMAGVVVGHVQSVRPHPNADKLRVCDVQVGEDEPVQIVCGAPNVAAGQKVPVATVGTTLLLPARKAPHALEPVEIAAATLRGEPSSGMICSADELGLPGGHDGILVLQDDAPVGQPFAAYLAAHGQAPDAVLDVNVTPNRPDATSHLGVARDLAALADAPLQVPPVNLPAVGGEAADAVQVQIDAPEACARYAAMVVRGVSVGPSPDWMRQRLEAVGVRPVNNVVDVTNYVMFERGQPLHAFDLNQLAPGDSGTAEIVVRRATKDEPFTTLDGQKRKLPEGALLICDARRPVAVAGVMGGENSEVTEQTTDVLIESAYFDPVTVRTTAKALGLQTDASYRFERGIDPAAQLVAAARAAQLLADVAGGTVATGAVDEHPRPHQPRTVTLRPDRLNRLLGADVPADEAARLLTAIGFEVADAESATLDAFAEAALLGETMREAAESAGAAGLSCVVPSFRPDVEREADLIEEVARLWGYSNVPQPTRTTIPLRAPRRAHEAAVRDRALDLLAGVGFREAFSNSLLPLATAERFNRADLTGVEGGVVQTLNPISEEMAALRPSLLPGLLAAVVYNQNRNAGALRLMEFGRIYLKGQDAGAPVPGYAECPHLLLAMSGAADEAGWDRPARAADFFDLKGAVTHLLGALGVENVEEEAAPAPDGIAAYRLTLRADGRTLGVLGRIDDALGAALDLRQPVFFADLDFSALAALAPRGPVATDAVSRFPAVERDLAVVVDAGQPVGPMLRLVRQTAGPLLQRARVFDLYRGENVGAGKKSVAFALAFGKPDATLTDKEADGRIKAILKRLQKEAGAELRA